MSDDDSSVQWSRPAVQPHDRVAARAVSLTSSKHTPARAHGLTRREELARQAGVQRLLARRVYTIEEYSREFFSRPTGRKVYTPGASPAPIPVPLESNESVDAYEAKFLAYIAARGQVLEDLQHNANHERSIRINFANKRLLPKRVVLRASASTAAAAGAKDDASAYPSQLPPRASKPPKRTPSPSPARSVASSTTASKPKATALRSMSTTTSTNKRDRSPSSSPAPRKRSDTTDRSTTPASASKPPPSTASSSNTNSSNSNQPAASVPTAAPTASAAPLPPPVVAVQRCVAQLPAPQASRTAFVAAYVACGCRQCMCDWNLMLTEQLDVLEREVRILRSAFALPMPLGAPAKPRMAHSLHNNNNSSNNNNNNGNSVDKAKHTPAQAFVQAPVKSELLVEQHPTRLPASHSRFSTATDSAAVALPPSSAPSAAVTAPVASTTVPPTAPAAAPLVDLIKCRMLDEYNALNSQILVNEHVVADSLERVQTLLADDFDQTMHEHEQIQQLQDAIEHEAERRDEALAMLIVHCYEHDVSALRHQLDALGGLNIAHAQRTSHAKCARFAAQITAKRELVMRLIAVLDRMRLQDRADKAGDNDVEALALQVEREQNALSELEAQRMREIMQLFQFSRQIRADCRSLLALPSSSSSARRTAEADDSVSLNEWTTAGERQEHHHHNNNNSSMRT